MKFVFITDLHLMEKCNSRLGDSLQDFFTKFDFVVDFTNKNDATLLIGGDVFHRYSVSDYVKIQFITHLKKCHKVPYVIFGNHDKMYNSDSKSDRTSLSLLLEVGVLKLLETENFTDFVLTSDVNVVTSKRRILMFHGFLNHDDEYNLPYDKVPSNSLVLLGHDHAEYQDLTLGSSLIIRPGSFFRESRVTTNLRIPKLVLIDTSKEDWGISHVEISVARDFNTLFSTVSKKEVAVDYSSFLSILKESQNSDDNSLSSLARRVTSNKDIINYLEKF